MIAPRKVKKKPMAEINVVPYIDVMLVLLVIFMVTAPLMLQGIQVDLPNEASAPIDLKKSEPLIASVKADGTYYLNIVGDPEQPKTLAEIKDLITKTIKQKPETLILVRGDEAARYGLVVSLMSDIQSAGATNIGWVTDPPN